MGIAFEILLQPSFATDELEKLKQRLRVQLRQQRSNANFLLSERFNRAVHSNHPAANVSVTAKSSTGSLRTDCVSGTASAMRRRIRSSASPAMSALRISSPN